MLVLALLLALPRLSAAADTPAAASGPYREAPMLADLVKAGKLPPVAQRLPAQPPVIEPITEVGRYGGTWRGLAITPDDSLVGSRLGYEPLVRWDRSSGRRIVPGLAERWEMLDGGRTYVFHLRPGLKWSDGEPFSSADLMFWYRDIVLNKDLTPAFPTWLSASGNPFEVTAPDAYTVAFHFDKPNGICLEIMAFRSHFIFAPAHYLKQFHVHYRPKPELERLAKAAGLNLWYEYFQQKANLSENPDLPTVRPWRIVIPPPATRLVVERNPYYWKVDPAGNQLPYIDRLAFTVVQNQEILNLKAMTGEVDFQARYIDPSKFTLFMENRRKGKYRVLADTSPTGVCIYLNQYSKDAALRPLLQDRRFRLALSVAINRAELIELIYSGLAEPSNAVSSVFDPYYVPGLKDRNIQYDPVLARRLLDEVGLRVGSDGRRLMPDGRPFHQTLNCYPSEAGTGPETWQLVIEYWREVGLHFSVKTDARVLSTLKVRNGDSDFWAYAIAGMHWVVDPIWYVPVASSSYHAPLYGRYYESRGKAGVPPRPEFQQIIDGYHELAGTCGNEARKLELGQRILSQWADNVYIVGIAQPKELTIVSNRMRNAPAHVIHDYRLMSPGYLNPEQFYLTEE